MKTSKKAKWAIVFNVEDYIDGHDCKSLADAKSDCETIVRGWVQAAIEELRSGKMTVEDWDAMVEECYVEIQKDGEEYEGGITDEDYKQWGFVHWEELPKEVRDEILKK